MVFRTIGFGKWQLMPVIAALLGPAALGPAMLSTTLTNSPLNFRCIQNKDFEQIKTFDNRCQNNTIITGSGANISNEVYDNTNRHAESFSPHIKVPNKKYYSNAHCSGWEYDTSVFSSTISMEWTLICEDAWLSSLYQIIISAGSMLGDIVGGAVGDRLGRTATLRYGSAVVVASVLGIGLLPFYSAVLVCRFFLGLTLSSIIYPTYNLVMEITPTCHRTVIGMLITSSYSVGVMIFAGLGYFLRDWRPLHFTSSIFAYILLSISWFVDESPRWLAQRGYPDKAKAVLQKAARNNKSTLPSDADLEQILQKLADEGGRSKTKGKNSTKGSFQLMFSNRPMTIIAIVEPMTWFLMAVIYMQIPLNVANVGRNPFIYLGLTGVMELIPGLIGAVFFKKVKRVPVMSVTFFITGLCIFLTIPLTKELWWLKWILIMSAMGIISATYMLNYVWAPELYPTVIRSEGCGSCAFLAHLGFLMAPLITDFMAKSVWWLPSVLLGICATIASGIVFLLPETRGLSLCETVKDVEDRWEKEHKAEF